MLPLLYIPVALEELPLVCYKVYQPQGVKPPVIIIYPRVLNDPAIKCPPGVQRDINVPIAHYGCNCGNQGLVFNLAFPFLG